MLTDAEFVLVEIKLRIKMDIPGQSLFQGGGSLELNNSAQKRQEQEELLDQLRLQNEESVIKNLAFLRGL